MSRKFHTALAAILLALAALAVAGSAVGRQSRVGR